MTGYEFFRGGTRLMAFLSFVFVAAVIFGILSSSMGGWPVKVNVGDISVSTSTFDGSLALILLSVWVGLLGAGILTRDRFIKVKKKS